MLNLSCVRIPVLPAPEMSSLDLHLDSTLQELSLYDFQVEVADLGIKVAQMLESNPLQPGVILTEQNQFAGMISRRRFLEYISRPFGRELFLKRPLKALYRFAQTDALIFTRDTPIVEAARQALKRPPELLYEPIVVQLAPQLYRLLDVHELLVAQSQIHELATQLLRQQTQAQLIQTEKLASLGQMVAGVAHEIRNPVTCILGNLGFLTNYADDILRLIDTYESIIPAPNEELETLKDEIEFEFLQQDLPEIFRSMQTAATRLNELVSSLRNFSHMDEAHPKEANLHECIDGTLLILKNRLKQGVNLIKNYGDLPPVSCYSGQLSQVFMNIIGNALDALDEEKGKDNFSPTIRIETEVIEASEGDYVSSELIQNHSLELANRGTVRPLGHPTYELKGSGTEAEKAQQPAWIAIRIADNGPGIPPEIQQRIFETFFTTKPVGKGTGLGLAISHQIITKKHSGKLNLHSTPGTGTEFEILLPLV